jgi:hypothetical protein
MSICQSQPNKCQQSTNACPDKFGCPVGVCPDFEIKRHDTQPPFAIQVEDCNGPLDLTNCIAEASMWAKARLKKPLAATDTYFALCDNVGFEQSLVGDIIVMDRVRAPEQMLVIGHDETNKLINVQRGYNGSAISNYPRGSCMRIFRVLNSVAETSMTYEDIMALDGTTTNTLIESKIFYNWQANDTCLPGCYWLEFKLLKMVTAEMWFMAANPIVPTFTSVTPAEEGCALGSGVEWARRFPISGDGFLIKITDSPTSENVG